MKTITKTKTIKKMSNGGNPPDGLSGKIGKTISIGGVMGGGLKMIGDAIRKRQAVVKGAKAIKAGNPYVKRKDAMKASRDFINNPVPKEKRDFINNPVPERKRGGAIKSKTKKQ